MVQEKDLVVELSEWKVTQYVKKMTSFCTVLMEGKSQLENWLDITIQRLTEIARKEVEKRKNGEKLSPFQIIIN